MSRLARGETTGDSSYPHLCVESLSIHLIDGSLTSGVEGADTKAGRLTLPTFILVAEGEKPSAFDIKGGRLIELPFEADQAALAVVRALSRLAAEGSAGPTVRQAIEAPRVQRRAG